MRTIACAALVAACGAHAPDTHYYDLAAPATPRAPGELTIAVEPFVVEPPYDDTRIVYRVAPHRVDYYEYHRWSADPGSLISEALARGLERSGEFRVVLRESEPAAPVVVGGRVIALEEVDSSKTTWNARLIIQVRITDRATGDVLWTQQYDEHQRMPAQSPDGLARAVTMELERIVAQVSPIAADLAQRTSQARTARATR